MDPYTVQGDCIEVMGELIRHRVIVQSVVTDSPYGIGFLNKDWDSPDNISVKPDVWRLCYQLLPPGGHLLAFAHPRTYHRIACAIADAGFEIRDQILWVHGQGFPKSLNVGRAIDRITHGGGKRGNFGIYGFWNNIRNPNIRDPIKNAATRERWKQGYKGNGAEGLIKLMRSRSPIVPVLSPHARQWEGWHSNLKPVVEPIVVARKPLERSVAGNVLKYGTGALNIDACRIPCDDKAIFPEGIDSPRGFIEISGPRWGDNHPDSRYPANFIHDGSEEVIELLSDKASFFYCARVSASERNGSAHPTMKPLSLMRYLVRLVTPPGGLVLDPFAGTGTTGEAAHLEGFDYLLIERDPEFVRDIERRLQKYNRAA